VGARRPRVLTGEWMTSSLVARALTHARWRSGSRRRASAATRSAFVRFHESERRVARTTRAGWCGRSVALPAATPRGQRATAGERCLPRPELDSIVVVVTIVAVCVRLCRSART
jgi:hypothetical protein